MGLDMFIAGVRYYKYDNLEEDNIGARKMEETVELAYWRKHPDLHGYIVNTFAGGVDNCEKILLEEKDLLRIKNAVNQNALPKTEGFLFGVSITADQQATLSQLDKAIDWISIKEEGFFKQLYYQASW